MPNIRFDFTVRAQPELVFAALSTPRGLSAWWTLEAAGEAKAGNEMFLGFGPGYDWRAEVSEYAPGETIEWIVTDADEDWNGTRLRIHLERQGSETLVQFEHSGWAKNSAHFRTSAFCWAMYFRLLRRYVEAGEVVPYAERQFA